MQPSIFAALFALYVLLIAGCATPLGAKFWRDEGLNTQRGR